MTMNCLPIQWRRRLILSAAVAFAACSSSSTTNDAQVAGGSGGTTLAGSGGASAQLDAAVASTGALQTVASAPRPPVVVDRQAPATPVSMPRRQTGQRPAAPGQTPPSGTVRAICNQTSAISVTEASAVTPVRD